MTYVVTLACVDIKDNACTLECPVDCIYEGGRMRYIHPDECIDCGACEPVCPVEAIVFVDDIDEQMVPFVAANEQFFEDKGMPRGASKFGASDSDAAFVAALPARSVD